MNTNKDRRNEIIFTLIISHFVLIAMACGLYYRIEHIQAEYSSLSSFLIACVRLYGTIVLVVFFIHCVIMLPIRKAICSRKGLVSRMSILEESRGGHNVYATKNPAWDDVDQAFENLRNGSTLVLETRDPGRTLSFFVHREELSVHAWANRYTVRVSSGQGDYYVSDPARRGERVTVFPGREDDGRLYVDRKMARQAARVFFHRKERDPELIWVTDPSLTVA